MLDLWWMSFNGRHSYSFSVNLADSRCWSNHSCFDYLLMQTDSFVFLTSRRLHFLSRFDFFAWLVGLFLFYFVAILDKLFNRYLLICCWLLDFSRFLRVWPSWRQSAFDRYWVLVSLVPTTLFAFHLATFTFHKVSSFFMTFRQCCCHTLRAWVKKGICPCLINFQLENYC